MFSGIVEAKAKILHFVPRSSLYELLLERPATFDDIRTGDSIAVNGVCLTVEAFDETKMQFAVAEETLRVTHWSGKSVLKPGAHVNLERSLRLGDRIHGHLVQGHVDAMGDVVSLDVRQESADLKIKIPQELARFVWKKGSLAINGVSLTVNSVDNLVVECCLIPETLKRTNLGELVSGSAVTLEVDSLARYYERVKELS